MKAVYKTISWRVIATATTASLAYLFTGAVDLAASIAGTEAVAKMIFYYIHEKIWERL